MNTAKHKLLSFLMALSMVASTLPVSVYAADVPEVLPDAVLLAEEESNETVAAAQAADPAPANPEAVNDVIAKIDAIGEVTYTPECKAKIDAAQKAYMALTKEQQKIVTNISVWEQANAKYHELELAHREELAKVRPLAQRVIDLGEITLADKAEIESIRAAYNALQPFAQEYFQNYYDHNYLTDLEAAEAKLAALEKAEADKAAAKAVEAKIDAIGEVTYTPECKAKIDAAQKAYMALTKEQQKLVSNIGVWEQANAKYHELELAHREELAKVRPLAQRVIDLGEITLADKAEIESIRAAYNALQPFAQEYFQNYYSHNYLTDLEAAEAKLAALEKAEADKAAAKAVEAKIDAIGEVTYTPECKAKIDAAKKAYMALTKEQQKLVTNISVWEQANAKYHELELAHRAELAKVRPLAQRVIDLGEITLADKAEIESIRAAYNALQPFAQEYFQNYYDHNYLTDLEAAEAQIAALEKAEADKAAINDVIAKIDAIGEVTYTPECKAKIDAAQKAYMALTKDQQKLVSNISVWEQANAKYHELELAHREELAKVRPLVQRVIDLGEITLADKAEIESIRAAYNALQPFAQEYFQNYYGHNYLTDLEAAEAQIAALEKAEADKAAANDVIAKIDAIGEVTYTPECKAKIDAAQKAYMALTKEQQKLVTNISVWEQANAKYHELELAHHEELAKVRPLVQRVIDLGEITLADKAEIESIRAAYNALQPFAQEYFQNYYDHNYLTDLENAEAKLAALEKAEADKAAVNDVIAKIDAIGEVTYTPECKAKIDAAQKAYMALTKEQRVLVTNISVWEQANAKYHELELAHREELAKVRPLAQRVIDLGEITLADKAEIESIRAAYNALQPFAQEYFQNYYDHNYLTDLEAAEAKLAALEKAEADKAAVNDVIAKIDAIGEVTYTPECKAKIDAAQKAYMALTKEQRALVTNIGVWEQANAKYHELELAHRAELAKVRPLAQRVIDLGEITLADKAEIESIRAAYNALQPFAQEYFQNYYDHNYLTDLEAAEAQLAALEKAEADKAAAKAVEDQIDAIGEVTYTPECKAKIDAALDAYKALTPEQQKLVSNLKVLEDAIAQYEKLKAEAETLKDGWNKDEHGWFYVEDGKKVLSDWRTDSKGWCFLGADGYMAINAWALDSQGWHFMDETGHMATNRWALDSVGWCYLDEQGNLRTNAWMQDSIGWCYLGADGRMVTMTWIEDSQGWCFLNEYGYMAYNSWALDSTGWCFLGDDGRITKNRWAQDSAGWCYLGSDGYMVTNVWMQDSIGWCYLGADGRMVKNQYVNDSTGPKWIGEDGYVIW